MSAVATLPARADDETPRASRRGLPRQWLRRAYPYPLLPTLATVANIVAVLVVRPNVGDLQAALAREQAAAHGVGLTYWFAWFGGGSTPGHYSVLSPLVTSWFGARVSGALATFALIPATYRLLSRTRFQVAGTWIATYTAALNMWSGRIPFALGCLAGVLGLIGLRERRWVLALLGSFAAVAFSPVTGAFFGMAVFAAWLTVRPLRRVAFVVGVVTAVTMLIVALYFGAPGPQGYKLLAALLVITTSLVMIAMRPAQPVRVVLWLLVVGAPLIWLIPNGLGSNLNRLPWVCLPAAVVATAGVRRWVALVMIVPSLVACSYLTAVDLDHSSLPAASSSYYDALGRQLDLQAGLANHRLEVVQNDQVHTAAVELVAHAALAGGFETQEQNEFNAILQNRKLLDASSYKVWLDNNAVGYVAFDKGTRGSSPEYDLVGSGKLSYLAPLWESDTWVLYKVQNASPIVPEPAALVSANQSSMTISVPCACTFHLRVRWSKFLEATVPGPKATAAASPSSGPGVPPSSPSSSGGASAAVVPPALVRSDSSGWTVITTRAAGRYVLKGRPI
jgi:hypothetical protein